MFISNVLFRCRNNFGEAVCILTVAEGAQQKAAQENTGKQTKGRQLAHTKSQHLCLIDVRCKHSPAHNQREKHDASCTEWMLILGDTERQTDVEARVILLCEHVQLLKL